MIKYNNTLVEVQFRDSEPSPRAVLTTDSQEAVDRAVSLAESEGSRLTFVTSFESHPASPSDVKAAQFDEDTVLPAVRREMDEMVNSAVAKNLDAAWEFLFGTAWKQLCNRVHTDRHDLLIVGTRKRSGFARTLLGGTAKRVSHFAPCPVWVVQHEQMSKIMDEVCLGSTPHLHIETGSPEDVVWRTVTGHDANLVVMGLVGRSGVQRYLIGDAAEKLLPELPCSVLMVKPKDFAYVAH
jgi:nucleotide-binding universal stress UspA family protein